MDGTNSNRHLCIDMHSTNKSKRSVILLANALLHGLQIGSRTRLKLWNHRTIKSSIHLTTWQSGPVGFFMLVSVDGDQTHKTNISYPCEIWSWRMRYSLQWKCSEDGPYNIVPTCMFWSALENWQPQYSNLHRKVWILCSILCACCTYSRLN